MTVTIKPKAGRINAVKIPVMSGLIDRRILVNFRVEPRVLEGLLPKPFRPKVVHGHGMAGVCLIRLKQLRPRFVPGRFGITSENAAHRIAVEWESRMAGVVKVSISPGETPPRG